MGRGHDGAGNWHTTYTAMPHFITNRLRSVFFEDTRYMEFDLCAERGQDIVDVMIAVGPNDAAGFETSVSRSGRSCMWRVVSSHFKRSHDTDRNQ